jgi:hypothetical protein
MHNLQENIAIFVLLTCALMLTFLFLILQKRAERKGTFLFIRGVCNFKEKCFFNTNFDTNYVYLYFSYLDQEIVWIASISELSDPRRRVCTCKYSDIYVSLRLIGTS